MSMILTSRSDNIFTVTFNRPEVHNALNDRMADELEQALHEARNDETVAVVILRGAGRSFCSGRDLREMGERPDESHFDYMRRGQNKIKLMIDLGKPMIAELRGAVIGAGCEFAMAADIRIAAADTALALPEINYGLAVDQGGSALATSLIGPSRAKWMLMTGEKVDAQTALQWGLVDFVVPVEVLESRVRELASKIAAKPPRALRAAKELVDELWVDGIKAAIRRELNQQLALFASPDFIAARERRRAAQR